MAGETGLERSSRESSDVMEEKMKFKERYLAGEIPFEEIDRYIEEWGNSDELCTLREYLGLNAEEEDVWISDSDEALQELLDSQKKAR